MKKIILSISLMVFAIYSCKKGIEYVNIPEISKQYGAFNIGSYWIFQNDSTLETDSIFTQDYGYGAIEEGNHNKVEKSIQTLSLTIRSKNDSVSCFVYNTQLIGSKRCIYVMQTKTGLVKEMEFWTDKPVLIRYSYPDTLSLIHHDQLVINGCTYEDVYEMNDTFNQNSNVPNVHVVGLSTFFVKKIGVIKNSYYYSDGTNETWSLLRYKVFIGD